MKKISTLLVGAFAFSTTFAQVNKLPFIEHFTQASCGPCASQNPTLKARLDAFGTENYVRISHQVSWPGVDPMNAAYPAGPETRRNYYSVTGVPNTSLNGGAAGNSGTVVTAQTLAAEAAKTTPYEIIVNQAWNGSDIDLTITVNNTTSADISSANKIYIALIEDIVSYASAPGNNGEKEFEFVMRQMYAASTGAANADAGDNLGTIVANGNASFNLTVTPPNYVRNLNQLSFAVYVQNNSTKEIMQAGKSTPVVNPSLLSAAIANTTVAADGYCTYTATPSFEVSNQGSSTFTSIVAEYEINGGTPVSKTFNTTLAAGATASFSFDGITLSPGSSTITTNVISINDTTSFASPAAMTGAPITFHKLLGTASDLDVIEGLENAPLDAGTGYSRTLNTAIFGGDDVAIASYSILDGPTYNYGAIGGFAASNRSIRFRFFSLSGNEKLELVMQKVNIPTNASLSFSHAYRQYAAENDRLEVKISTDCGDTWTTIFNEAGSALKTLPASNTQYTPGPASDWRKTSLDLSSYANVDDVVIKFVGTSAYGNNLFLDDIEMKSTVGIHEVSDALSSLNIYPNPSVGVTYLDLGNTKIEKLNISIYNTLGELVSQETLVNPSNSLELNTNALPVGAYQVNCHTVSDNKTFKLIIQK